MLEGWSFDVWSIYFFSIAILVFKRYTVWMWHSFLHMDKDKKEKEQKEEKNQPWEMASLYACYKSQGALEWPSEI